ncbi:MAG: DUF3343 domain-containing protein [Anaerolineae bacterium]|nr:DUF3343 domain-containing protein [Anaerolineae bacterium]
MSDFGVVIFHTTSAALRAEKAALAAGLKVKLIPTPRQFSSDCGMSLRFDWECEAAVREALERTGADWSAIQRLA